MNTCRFCFSTFFAFLFSFAVSGCSSAYVNAKSVTAASDFPGVIERAKKDKRSFILHSGINVYTIANLQLDKAKQNVHVQLNKLDSINVVQIEDPNNQPTANGQGQSAKGEIHFYMKDSMSYLLEEPYTISLEKVARIDLTGKS